MGNGGEYISNKLHKWFREKVINPEFSPPYSPESNAGEERSIRTLLDKARTMVNPLGIDHRGLWEETVASANYSRKIMFSAGCQRENLTPYETLTGTRPDVSHFCLYSFKYFAHILKQFRSGKFGSQARTGSVVGYGNGDFYKVYVPETKTKIISRDVRMVEKFNSKTS